jgi:histidine triad (HIT) family protein
MAGQDKDCIFCGIVSGKMKSWKIYQNGNATAFLDINPRNPGHTIVVTNKHFETMMDLPENETGPLFNAVRKVSLGIVNGTAADGVSIAQSSGASAGQLVRHIHVHIIPRFGNEDAVSLEGILPVKNITDKEKDEIVKKISSKIPK